MLTIPERARWFLLVQSSSEECGRSGGMAFTRKKPEKKRAAIPSASSGKQKPARRRPLTVFTIGHSTRTIDDFIDLLRAHGVRQLADVRTIPRSRHNPQFGQDQLGPALERAGIHYRHMPALGGLRRARRDSVNTAWRNASFRGYADYMQTQPFRDALDELVAMAREQPTAIMCAEAVPWRCHRSLIADALLVRRIDAEEISSPTRTQPHKLTPWARVAGENIAYPAAETPPAKNQPAPTRRRRSSQNG
jgi:hypothetical protein